MKDENKRCKTDFTEVRKGSKDLFLPLFSLSPSVQKFLSTVGAGKNHPVNAVSQFDFVEVDQQTKRHIEQFHVAKQLCLMNRQNFLHGLKFQQQAFFNKNIQAQRFLKSHSFVFNFHVTLGDARNAPQIEFTHQTLFINAFDQPRPLQAMNFDGRADDLTAQSMRFQIEEMHQQISQKAAKEAKIFPKQRPLPSFAVFAFFCSKSSRLP